VTTSYVIGPAGTGDGVFYPSRNEAREHMGRWIERHPGHRRELILQAVDERGLILRMWTADDLEHGR